MIQSFGHAEARRIFEEGKCKKLPKHLLKRTMLLLDMMDNVDSLKDLRLQAFPPDIRLHGLKGAMKGRYALDIHKLEGWRITSGFKDGMFFNVMVENYHGH